MIISLTNVSRVSLGCQLKLHDRYRFIVNTWKTGRPRRLQKPRGTRPFVRCATYRNHRQKPVWKPKHLEPSTKTSLETETFGTIDKNKSGNRNDWNHRQKPVWNPKHLEPSTKTSLETEMIGVTD